jgi:hypothetical protein
MSTVAIWFLLNKKGPSVEEPSNIWRRGWDLNPRRAINPCWFSRPVHSTALPPLRVRLSGAHCACSKERIQAVLPMFGKKSATVVASAVWNSLIDTTVRCLRLSSAHPKRDMKAVAFIGKAPILEGLFKVNVLARRALEKETA